MGLSSIGMDKAYYFIVDQAGARLDKHIADKFPELSRTYVQRLISEGGVKVNGHPARPGYKLAVGDKIAVVLPPVADELPLPEDIPLVILYEDGDLLVIDKPPGLTTHPAPGHPRHTLVNAVLSYLPELADSEDSFRPGIVHRLDKDTSGVMLVAKNNQARANLVGQFKSRAVNKIYTVLVKGHLTPDVGVIEAPIGRDPRNRKRMAVVAAGREARTDYRVLEYLDNYTLLAASPKTGRTHQIRVHLAAIGFPVVGDITYGVKSPHVPRQFIHASRIGFQLPASGEYVEFVAALPPDLVEALARLA